MSIFVDDYSKIKYRDCEDYLDMMLKDPNSVSDDVKLILADYVNGWIYEIRKNLLDLKHLLIRYLEEGKYSSNGREKYMLMQKIKDIHSKLEYEYYDWINNIDYWNYIKIFADEDHSSFKYYFDQEFEGKYDVDYMFSNGGIQFLRDNHLIGEIVY